MLLSSVRKTGRLVTVEEHYVYGGLGTAASDLLAQEYPVKIKKLGIPHDYATSGPYREILAKYGLNAEGIADSIQRFLEQ